MELPYQPLLDQIENVYNEKVGPLENLYAKFYTSEMEALNLATKPFILVLGQEGTGKTCFIRHLIGQEFPGMKLNTDYKRSTQFTTLIHSLSGNDHLVPGNVHVADPSNEFSPLARFGNKFLENFQCSMLNSKVLENMSIVDSPGIQISNQEDRGYDFLQVIKWFAERADRIFLLFDPCTLNISAELSQVLQTIQRHERRIRIILNKIDILDKNELRRVQGKLLWNLGRIKGLWALLGSTEIPAIITGAYNATSFLCHTHQEFFQEDLENLLKDLQEIPENPAMRKLRQLKKRTLLAIVHGYVLGSMRNHMPLLGALSYSSIVKTFLLKNLKEIYMRLCNEHQFCLDDFPDIEKLQETLQTHDFYTFPLMQNEMLETAKEFLRFDSAILYELAEKEDVENGIRREIVGGAFDILKSQHVDTESKSMIQSGPTESVVTDDDEFYEC